MSVNNRDKYQWNYEKTLFSVFFLYNQLPPSDWNAFSVHMAALRMKGIGLLNYVIEDGDDNAVFRLHNAAFLMQCSQLEDKFINIIHKAGMEIKQTCLN